LRVPLTAVVAFFFLPPNGALALGPTYTQNTFLPLLVLSITRAVLPRVRKPVAEAFAAPLVAEQVFFLKVRFLPPTPAILMVIFAPVAPARFLVAIIFTTFCFENIKINPTQGYCGSSAVFPFVPFFFFGGVAGVSSVVSSGITSATRSTTSASGVTAATAAVAVVLTTTGAWAMGCAAKRRRFLILTDMTIYLQNKQYELVRQDFIRKVNRESIFKKGEINSPNRLSSYEKQYYANR